jgi:hypothetical protein
MPLVTTFADPAPEPTAAAPVPSLLAARAQYQAARERVWNINRLTSPLKRQIDDLKTRQATLTGERGTVTSVERLREIKAALVDIDDALEIAERQYAPLAKPAESSSTEASRLGLACNSMRERAVKALENARREHFLVKHNRYGAKPQHLPAYLQALADFVGEEDVETYVTSLTWETETAQHVPPWASVRWCDAS